MRKLTVRQKDGSQKECGCTFALATGFNYVCDAHLRVVAGVKADRQKVSAKPKLPLFNSGNPELASELDRMFGGKQEDSPELTAAVVAECERRAEIARSERAKIKKPSSKLTKAERAHLHTFAFSSIQVREDLLRAAKKVSKKHDGPRA